MIIFLDQKNTMSEKKTLYYNLIFINLYSLFVYPIIIYLSYLFKFS